MDGSFHRWFGPHYGYCCLIAMIDDATGELYARFVAQEYAESVVSLLGGWIERHGILYALYFDQQERLCALKHAIAVYIP